MKFYIVLYYFQNLISRDFLIDDGNERLMLELEINGVEFIPAVQQIFSSNNLKLKRYELFFRPKGVDCNKFYNELSDEESCIIANEQLLWMSDFIKELDCGLIDEIFFNIDPVVLSSTVEQLFSLSESFALRNVDFIIEITERKLSCLNFKLIEESSKLGLIFAVDDFFLDDDPRKCLLHLDCIRYIKVDVNIIEGNELSFIGIDTEKLIIENVESIEELNFSININSGGVQGFLLGQVLPVIVLSKLYNFGLDLNDYLI